MKKLLVSLCIILIGITSYAKSIIETNVPVMVKNAFYNDYPKAEHVKWEVTKVNDYRANFRIAEEYGSVYYTKDGEYIESDITIPWKDVPFTGRMGIYHLNKKGHITNVLKIETVKQEVFYLIFAKRKLKHFEILLDKDGYIINNSFI